MSDLGCVVDVVFSVGASFCMTSSVFACAFGCASACVIELVKDKGLGGDELNISKTRSDMVLD